MKKTVQNQTANLKKKLTNSAEEATRSTAADAVLLDGGDGRLETLLILDETEVVVRGQIEARLAVDGDPLAVDGGHLPRAKRVVVGVNGGRQLLGRPLVDQLVLFLRVK